MSNFFTGIQLISLVHHHVVITVIIVVTYLWPVSQFLLEKSLSQVAVI